MTCRLRDDLQYEWTDAVFDNLSFFYVLIGIWHFVDLLFSSITLNTVRWSHLPNCYICIGLLAGLHKNYRTNLIETW